MKINYFPDTDSLYIDLSELPSVESREISEGVVLDYDKAGNLVGIDIDNASSKVELHELVVSRATSPGRNVGRRAMTIPEDASKDDLTAREALRRALVQRLRDRGFHLGGAPYPTREEINDRGRREGGDDRRT